MDPCVLVNHPTPAGLQEEENHFGIPILGHVTHDQLLEQFENLGHFAGGGEAAIFKVRHRGNEKIYALRIQYEMRSLNLYRRKPFFEQMFKIQNNTLHLAKVYAVFWLTFKNYPFVAGKKKGVLCQDAMLKGQIIPLDYANDPEANTYHLEVTIMELGGGDLEGAVFREMNKDPLATCIQQLFNSYCLQLAKIWTRDNKLRNYIWKPVEGEYFNGQLLSKYRYWHYTIQGQHFYIPRPSLLIKRIDFSDWSLDEDEDEEFPASEPNWLQLLAEEKSKTISEMLERYAKPAVPDEEILDINP